MFQMSENKITAVVGAIFLQNKNYCLILFFFFSYSFFFVIVFRSLETDLN